MKIETSPSLISSPPHRDPAMVQAATELEALFLDQLMVAMRKTVPHNEMDLRSSATDLFESLQDTQMISKLAQAGGVGLADQLIQFFDQEPAHPPPLSTPLTLKGPLK